MFSHSLPYHHTNPNNTPSFKTYELGHSSFTNQSISGEHSNDINKQLPDLNHNSNQDQGPELLVSNGLSTQMQPYCNPPCLQKIQRNLPWYYATVKAGGGPWLSLRSWEAPYQWFTKEIQQRWKNKAQRWLLCCRLLFASILIICLLIANVILQMDLYTNKASLGIYDLAHQLTFKINRWLYSTNELAFFLIVFLSSFTMDMLFLTTWFQWIIIGDSSRLPIAYILFYGFRGLVRSLSIFPFPEYVVWKIPELGGVKVPSLTTSYQLSDDFFFSGHVGCGVLAILEHFYYRCWWGVAACTVVTVCQVFVLTVTRIHYTVDMIAGAIIASWFHMIAQRICRPIDQWLGLPPRPLPEFSIMQSQDVKFKPLVIQSNKI